jgi:hypothetical protein
MKVLESASQAYPIFWAALAVGAAIPCLILRRQLNFGKGDVGLAVLPLAVWIVLFARDDMGKTMSNAYGEPLLLGIVVAAIFSVRLVAIRYLPRTVVAFVAMVAACTVAIAFWRFIPPWLE